MIITIPQPIDDTTLVSSNVPAGDYPDWTAGTYNLGDKRVVGGSIYEVTALTTTDEPVFGSQQSPKTWIRLGYINRLRMFNDTSDSKTTLSASDIDVRFKSADNYYGLLGLLGLVGQSVTVEVYDSVGTLQQTLTADLVDIGVGDWAAYFFQPYDQIESVVFTDIRYEVDGEIRAIIEGEGGDTSCGRVILGSQQVVGTTLYDTTVGLLTFTTFERDGFGNLSIRPGRTVNTADFRVDVDRTYVDSALRILRAAGGKIAFYVGEEDEEATYILGIAEEPRINYTTPSKCNLSLEVQGQ